MNDPALRLQHDADVLGTFSHLNLHARIATAPTESPQGDPVTAAFARYAPAHERRHFHDFFGTYAGQSLWYAHFFLLRDIVPAMLALRQLDEHWTLPFTPWMRSSKYHEVFSPYMSAWSRYRASLTNFTNAFQPLTGPQPREDEYAWRLSTDTGDRQQVVFPYDVGIRFRGTEQRIGVYYPVGFTELLEGIAQSIQRTLAEVEQPNDVMTKFMPGKTQYEIVASIDNKPSTEFAILPEQRYNVTDLMVTKYLRTKGRDKFLRTTIMKLSDITLSSSGFAAKDRDSNGLPLSYDSVSVGDTFYNLLTRTDIEALVDASITYPEYVTSLYQEMLKATLDWERPSDINYRGDMASVFRLLEAVVRHEIIAPLIRARLESEHSVFYSVYDYMTRATQLPEVPVVEDKDGLLFASYMTDAAVDAWLKYVMFGRIVDAVLGGARRVACPRADGSVGGLAEASFCSEGECAEQIKRDRCSPWYPARPQVLPDCAFRSVLALTTSL